MNLPHELIKCWGEYGVVQYGFFAVFINIKDLAAATPLPLILAFAQELLKKV
jgi:hypothetical protein